MPICFKFGNLEVAAVTDSVAVEQAWINYNNFIVIVINYNLVM